MAPLDGSGSVKEEDEDKDNASNPNPSTNGEVSVGGGISIRSATGKKRGTIFKCESCSKVSLSLRCNAIHSKGQSDASLLLRLLSVGTSRQMTTRANPKTFL